MCVRTLSTDPEQASITDVVPSNTEQRVTGPDEVHHVCGRGAKQALLQHVLQLHSISINYSATASDAVPSPQIAYVGAASHHT